MGWVTKYAPTDAELSACVQCGLCLPYCPTFRLTGKETHSPRGRLMAMSAVAEGIAEIDDAFEDIVGSCLQCRACETPCPSMVPFGRAMEGTRAEVAAQRPQMVRRLRHVVLGRSLTWRRPLRTAATVGKWLGAGRVRSVMPSALRSGLSGLRADAGSAPLPRGETFPAFGTPIGRAALLAGCVMDSWFRPVHEATIGVLRHAGYDVVIPIHQTCCGALAAHDGATADTERMAVSNVQAFASFDVIIVDAAGCSAHLKDYGHWAGAAGAELARRTFEVTEVVARRSSGGAAPSNHPSSRPRSRPGSLSQSSRSAHLRRAARCVASGWLRTGRRRRDRALLWRRRCLFGAISRSIGRAWHTEGGRSCGDLDQRGGLCESGVRDAAPQPPRRGVPGVASGRAVLGVTVEPSASCRIRKVGWLGG